MSEIRTKSRVEMEWFWVPGKLNPADMGTRLMVTPADMEEESAY